MLSEKSSESFLLYNDMSFSVNIKNKM